MYKKTDYIVSSLNNWILGQGPTASVYNIYDVSIVNVVRLITKHN